MDLDQPPRPKYDGKSQGRRRRSPSRTGEIDRQRRRDRSRSRSRERRRRSRTPDSGRRRSPRGDERDRSRTRDSGRDRERRGERHRRRDRSLSADDESSRRHRHRGHHRRDEHEESSRKRRKREEEEEEEEEEGGHKYGFGDRRSRPRSRPLSRSRSPEYANTDRGTPLDGKSRSVVKRGAPLPSQDDSFAVSKGEEPEKPKEKPNYGNSGVLAAASNQVRQEDGSVVTLKYHEPPEARKPPPRDEWKLFVFKNGEIVDTVDLGGRSCWLVGRELSVVDLPAEHPSISKQHAVIQFRYVEKRNEFGDRIGRVKPYLIDLESANGTLLNKERIPESRYLELRDKDLIQFGLSTREYVIMLAPR